ncbi:MAG: AAA family ATPase [Phycisphaerae bacterium]|nr:AAA family ATPase [Phycisphaerae bacterium]
MRTHSDADRLASLFAGRCPCVRIVTREEGEALELVRGAVARLGSRLAVQTWSVVQGVRRSDVAGDPPVPDTEHPAAALVHWRLEPGPPAIRVALDLADHLADARTVRALRELVEHLRDEGHAAALQSSPEAGIVRSGTLVLVDHAEVVPPVLESLAVRFDLTLPDDGAIQAQVRRTVQRLHRERPVDVDMSKGVLASIVKNLRGLTLRQVDLVITDVVADDRRFDEADVPRVIAGKRRLLAGAGLLEFVESPASMDEIGGLDRLKRWLAARKRAFLTGGEQGIPAPRGVLLLGVQGAGKSLSAKAIATGWQRPLLRLDAGVLYDKFVGESERKLREALKQADAMAPVVLWVDEIEKAFAGAAGMSTDGGLSRRMFGTLLTWMQERTTPVFLVATANDIGALPPELMRKGRFDEIFFVDLPGPAVRRRIVEIHLSKRGLETSAFDLDALASACEGFSGAEIEQAVLSALTEARDAGHEVTTADVERAMRGSPPLSVTMAERVEELRAWAKGRCVPAD